MTKRYKTRDEAILRRLAHALAWDMACVESSGGPRKGATPKRLYASQTEGGQMRFDEMARDLLPCLRRAGLVVKLRGDR